MYVDFDVSSVSFHSCEIKVDITKNKNTRESIDRSKKALSLLERMNKRFAQPKNRVKSRFIEAQIYANQGKEQYARSLLEKAGEEYDNISVKDVDMRMDFARANIMSGDKQKAYQELHILSQECKDKPEVLKRIDRISEEPISVAGKVCAADLSKKGIEAYQKKDFDESITIFSDALKMFPNHVGVNLNLVQAILAKNEVDGKNITFYEQCSDCFERIGIIDVSHKQYARYQFLFEQFQREYKGYDQAGRS